MEITWLKQTIIFIEECKKLMKNANLISFLHKFWIFLIAIVCMHVIKWYNITDTLNISEAM